VLATFGTSYDELVRLLDVPLVDATGSGNPLGEEDRVSP